MASAAVLLSGSLGYTRQPATNARLEGLISDLEGTLGLSKGAERALQNDGLERTTAQSIQSCAENGKVFPCTYTKNGNVYIAGEKKVGLIRHAESVNNILSQNKLGAVGQMFSCGGRYYHDADIINHIRNLARPGFRSTDFRLPTKLSDGIKNLEPTGVDRAHLQTDDCTGKGSKSFLRKISDAIGSTQEAADTKLWKGRASSQDGAYCPGGTKTPGGRPTHPWADPGRDSFLSLSGEEAIKGVADILFPGNSNTSAGTDPFGVWTEFPSKAVYSSPQRRTLATAMILFANQDGIHGDVCPWVHEVVHTTSDLGLDAKQLRDFVSKYAASTGKEVAAPEYWDKTPFLKVKGTLETGLNAALSALPNKWSTSAVPAGDFFDSNNHAVNYVKQSFLKNLEPTCTEQAQVKFNYIKPGINTDEKETAALEARLSAAKWYMMRQKPDEQIYVTHSGVIRDLLKVKKPANGGFFMATLRAHPDENGGEPYFKDIMPFRQKACKDEKPCDDKHIPVFLGKKDMKKWLKNEMTFPDHWAPP